MNCSRIILIACVLALTMSCSTVSVNYDFDPDADFAALRTFDWLPLPAEARRHELVIKRVRHEVRTQLGAKGITRVADHPDFLIALHGGRQSRVDVIDWGYTYGRYGRYWGRGVEFYEYDEATLVLDFIDARKKELIWRGSATGIVDPYATPEQRSMRIREAVTKILAHFPPER